jgi:hypothetical protein
VLKGVGLDTNCGNLYTAISSQIVVAPTVLGLYYSGPPCMLREIILKYATYTCYHKQNEKYNVDSTAWGPGYMHVLTKGMWLALSQKLGSYEHVNVSLGATAALIIYVDRPFCLRHSFSQYLVCLRTG